MDWQALLDNVLSDVQAYRGQGKPADYIAALKQVDPKKFGMALVLKDGTSFVAGDGDEPFSIQSISYVFSLALALHHVKAALWNHVGREPAGTPANSIIQLELARGKPRNPLTAAAPTKPATNCSLSCGSGQATTRSASTSESPCPNRAPAPLTAASLISLQPSAT
jgi:glutaminase